MYVQGVVQLQAAAPDKNLNGLWRAVVRLKPAAHQFASLWFKLDGLSWEVALAASVSHDDNMYGRAHFIKKLMQMFDSNSRWNPSEMNR